MLKTAVKGTKITVRFYWPYKLGRKRWLDNILVMFMQRQNGVSTCINIPIKKKFVQVSKFKKWGKPWQKLLRLRDERNRDPRYW